MTETVCSTAKEHGGVVALACVCEVDGKSLKMQHFRVLKLLKVFFTLVKKLVYNSGTVNRVFFDCRCLPFEMLLLSSTFGKNEKKKKFSCVSTRNISTLTSNVERVKRRQLPLGR